MKAKDLKNSILQMAVEGKLVPQDPSDDNRPRRIDHLGVKKHRSAATRLHAVRSRSHARRNASINEALIQIEAFSARANEHVACVFCPKHR